MRRTVLAPATALLAVLWLAVSPAAASVSVVWEKDLTANLLNLAYPYDDAFEPIVATHPFDAGTLAVTFEYKPTSGSRCGIIPGIRISTDGGATWTDTPRRPWAGSGRFPNWHAAIAWGPGRTAGSARLYWADTTVSDCTFNDHRLSVSYSDDLGATWAPLFVYNGTPATPFGGFPDITVDRNPQSPNYGTVYAAINWIPTSASEPGMRVIASSDFGSTWQEAEVPPLKAPAGYPFRYRIGYRLRSAPDGALYASFCEADRTRPGGSVGRLAFGVARLNLDRQAHVLNGRAPTLAATVGVNSYNLGSANAPGTHDRQRLDTCYEHGLDVDQASGRVYLALTKYRPTEPVGVARGIVRLGRSDDRGLTWSWQTLPSLAAVSGRAQSAHRATLVVNGGLVFVGFHVLADVALGTSYSANATIGTAFVVSRDGGASWGAPRLVSAARWHPDWLDYSRNAAGIRDRADLTAGGQVFYAYGDGRQAALSPDARWGRSQIYGALMELGQ